MQVPTPSSLCGEGHGVDGGLVGGVGVGGGGQGGVHGEGGEAGLARRWLVISTTVCWVVAGAAGAHIGKKAARAPAPMAAGKPGS